MKVLVFPKDPNPYQELLYAPLRKHATVAYLTARFDGPFRAATFVPRLLMNLAKQRAHGYRILHVHWLHTLTVPPFVPFAKRIAYLQTLLFVYGARALGYKIVWTMHNLLPHEPQTSNDLKVMQNIVKLASVVVVHSKETIREMKVLGLPADKCVVVPIGSYDGIYTSMHTRDQARKRLKVKPREFVILFFGAIVSYKGVDDLLCAFRTASMPNSRLIIAGKSNDASLTKSIRDLSEGLNVDFINKFIPDSEVEVYYKASDVVCLPFKKITTSSSVLLGMAFEKPVITPRLGALKDIPTDAALFYGKEANALPDALLSAAASKDVLHTVGNAGYQYSKNLSWDKIALKTYAIYTDILQNNRTGNNDGVE